MTEKASVTIDFTAYGALDERETHDCVAAWDELDNDQRVAALDLVHGSLLGMLDNLDEWVPQSFVAASQTRLDIMISFDLVEVNAAVLRRHRQAERKMKDMRADLLALRDDLDD